MIVVAVAAWVALVPDLAPELSTPDGPYRLSLSGSKDGDDLLLVNTRCGLDGAEGTIVNLGDSRVHLVLRTTYSSDEWERATVDSALLRVPARADAPWTVSNTRSAGEIERPCRAAILAARRPDDG